MIEELVLAILCELMFSIAVEAVDDGGAVYHGGTRGVCREAVDAPAFPVSLVEIVTRTCKVRAAARARGETG